MSDVQTPPRARVDETLPGRSDTKTFLDGRQFNVFFLVAPKGSGLDNMTGRWLEIEFINGLSRPMDEETARKHAMTKGLDLLMGTAALVEGTQVVDAHRHNEPVNIQGSSREATARTAADEAMTSAGPNASIAVAKTPKGKAPIRPRPGQAPVVAKTVEPPAAPEPENARIVGGVSTPPQTPAPSVADDPTPPEGEATAGEPDGDDDAPETNEDGEDSNPSDGEGDAPESGSPESSDDDVLADLEAAGGDSVSGGVTAGVAVDPAETDYNKQRSVLADVREKGGFDYKEFLGDEKATKENVALAYMELVMRAEDGDGGDASTADPEAVARARASAEEARLQGS